MHSGSHRNEKGDVLQGEVKHATNKILYHSIITLKSY